MSHRRSRVAALLRERLAQVLRERVSDPRLEGISIIEVRSAPDGSFARVFYRSGRERSDVEAALASAKPFIRRCLSEGLEMRRVPELDFRYDPAEASGERMGEILDELRKAGKDESQK